ncbi:MAG: nitrilase/cyanide hydratase and apolipoprotein N-acyltransferase [Nocardioidaceae bacterium]|nr:MAG: nitrilase/cyanide hydratase and apolipoprotein N-acyltransferase [Nocardioidaceae bacterium]
MSSDDHNPFRTIRVAAVQAESSFINLDESVATTIRLIEEAAVGGAELIAFPENFVPCYPNWWESLPEGPLVRSFDAELFKNSVEVPGRHVDAIAEACGRNGIYAVVGVNERKPGTTGTTWNTQIHITREGKIAGKHQKYVTTSGERQIQAPGRTGYYNSFRTDFGTVSGLICGENSNPLAQYAAAVHYPVIHVAAWPSYFYDYFPMRHAIHTASAGLAYSLKAFVINSASRISEEYIKEVGIIPENREFLIAEREKKHGALILDPIGRVIADGTGDDADLLFADLDLSAVLPGKLIHDVAGHYNRPEIFAPLFEPEFLESHDE